MVTGKCRHSSAAYSLYSIYTHSYSIYFTSPANNYDSDNVWNLHVDLHSSPKNLVLALIESEYNQPKQIS